MHRLGRGGVGRVAVTVNALPAIFPVNYATIDGDIVFRSGPGTKLTAALAQSIVAFEIDEADPFLHEGWSVLIVGPTRPVTDPDELALVSALPLAPWAEGDDSDAYIRLRSELVSGRQITHAAPEFDDEDGCLDRLVAPVGATISPLRRRARFGVR